MTSLAGPALHIVLVAIMAAIQRVNLEKDLNPFLTQAVLICLWTNVYMLIINFLPRMVGSLGANTSRDGWGMYKILTSSKKELRLFNTAYYTYEAGDAVDRGDLPAAKEIADRGIMLYPDDPSIMNIVGYVFSALHQYQKSREAFLKLYENNNTLDACFKFLVMNNIAFSNVMLEDETLREQADEFSRQAYGNFPWEPAYAGTRGAVLVWLGRVDEGINLLKIALSSIPLKQSKALNSCFVARGEIQRGNLLEAQKYLEAARQLDPSCPLIERVQRELTAAEAAQPS